jgi:hypothetical protein
MFFSLLCFTFLSLPDVDDIVHSLIVYSSLSPVALCVARDDAAAKPESSAPRNRPRRHPKQRLQQQALRLSYIKDTWFLTPCSFLTVVTVEAD